jgi:hypothetical protein
MAYPAGLTLITVTGQVASVADIGQAYVTFHQPVWLLGPDPGAFVPSGGQVATCNSDGEFSIALAATDDPDWTPVDWSYAVAIYCDGALTHGTLQLAYDGPATVDLATAFQPDETPEPGVSYALLSTVTGLDNRVTALEEAPGGTAPAWTSITGKPSVFPPEPHDQAISTITGLSAQLAALTPLTTFDDLDDRVTALEDAPGGGGTAATITRARVTSGDVTVSADAAWTPVAGLSLAVPAVVGDNVTIDVACLISHTDSSFYELAVLVGGSPVRYASTGTSSPAGAGEGDPSMYPLAGSTLHPLSTFMDLQVEGGDLSGGTVTFALMHKGSGGGKVYASTQFPFRWTARNDHQ